MRKISKIFSAVAVITMASAVMAITASAMTATYADKNITLTDVTGTGASQSVLVVEGEGAEVTETNIKQLDQKDDGTSFVTVPVGILADGTYEVRIGGDGTVQTATFVVNSPVDETEDLLIGDINGDGAINSTDASYVQRYGLGFTSRVGNAGTEKTKEDTTKVLIGDVNSDTDINATDASYVQRYGVGYTSRVGETGTTIKVLK